MSIKKKEIELLNILLIELFSLFTGLNNNKTNEDIETIIYNYDSVRLMATETKFEDKQTRLKNRTNTNFLDER